MADVQPIAPKKGYVFVSPVPFDAHRDVRRIELW
jgi:hypothetical protein